MPERSELTIYHLNDKEQRRLDLLQVEYRLEILAEQKLLQEKLKEREEAQAKGLVVPSVDQLKAMHPNGIERTETQVLALAEERAKETVVHEHKQRLMFEKYERDHGEAHPLAPQKAPERDNGQAKDAPKKSKNAALKKKRTMATKQQRSQQKTQQKQRDRDFGREIDR